MRTHVGAIVPAAFTFFIRGSFYDDFFFRSRAAGYNGRSRRNQNKLQIVT
jgi:hypothetical protein